MEFNSGFKGLIQLERSR